MPILGRHKREALALLFALSFLAAAVIWIRTATVKDTYAYVDQEKKWQKLQQESQEARVRWLRLTAPRRLEAMAASFGLNPPQIEQVMKYQMEKGQAKRASR